MISAFRQPAKLPETVLIVDESQAVNIRILTAVAAVLLAACQSAAPPSAASSDTLIVFYDVQTGDAPLLAAVQRERAKILYRYRQFNGLALSLPSGSDAEQAAARLRQTRGVLSVEPDRIMTLHTP